jgi:hypothetical protein
MPSPYVRQLAKETGESVATVEKMWDKAKEITADTFGKSEGSWGDREYSYTVGTVKNMLGINEKLNASEFIKSEKGAKEFIEDAMVISAEMGIDKAMTKDKEDKDDLEGRGEIKKFDDPDVDTADKNIKKTNEQPLVSEDDKFIELNKQKPLPENYNNGDADEQYLKDLEKWEEAWEKLAEHNEEDVVDPINQYGDISL